MTYFIDTNVFLEVEFKDPRWQESKNFLYKIENGEIEAVISDFIVYSCILEIEAKTKSAERIRKFIKGLQLISGLSIFHPTYVELLNALNFMKKNDLDFDDALVVSSMIANKIRVLVSFDTDFDRVKEIKRVGPDQI